MKVIRIWKRIKRFFSPEIVFFSRWEKFKWWAKVLDKLAVIYIILFGTVGAVLFLSVFGVPSTHKVGHGLDSREVNVSYSEIREVKSRYSEDLEKGFCVYGYSTEESIVVKDIVHDDEPLVQKEGRVSFLCIDETLNRLPKLVKSSRYQLVGNIHTHPSDAVLSRGDAFSFGALQLVQDTYGVYDGSYLRFYTPGSLSYSLGKNVDYGSSRAY